jgi:hypothetical protein
MTALWGEDDAETLRARNNLAGTIAAEGDLIGAETLLQVVVAASCRALGDQHPDTLTAMGNLAAVLWQAGNEEGAYALQYQVVELQRHVLGPGHPATQLSEATLAMMERAIEVWCRPV